MAIAPVVIDFLVKGIPDVQRAFRSVEQTIIASERVYTRAAETGARARLKSVSTEATDKIRAYKSADREHARSLAHGTREAERAARAETRAVQQSARDKIRAYQSADREHSRALSHGQREAEKAARAESRAFERSEREKNQAASRWVRQREAEANRKGQQYGRAITGAGGRAASILSSGAQRLGGTLLQLGGGFSVADTVQASANLERESVGFVNAAPNKAGLDSKRIQEMARAASVKTGIDAGTILGGSRAFLSKTGNAQEALQNMNLFGEIATGTGADIGDVAKAAGTLRIQNANLTPKEMQETLLQVVKQGQLGSIEFADLAGSIGKITKSSSSYAGNQMANQGKLLGLAQVAMATSGSPQEAATVISNISADAMKHADKVGAKLGKGTFNKQGQIAQAPEEFIADVMGKTGGNLQTIQGMGFGARSMKMFQALAPAFNDAQAAGHSGRDVVLKKMRDSAAQPMEYKELQANVSRVMNTSAMQFETSVNELKMAMGQQLLPEFVKLVPVLRDATPYMVKVLQGFISLAEWAAQNPLKAAFVGLGSMVGKTIVGEILSAKIGSLIARAMGGGGGGGGGVVRPPVPGGGGGVLPQAAALGIATGAVVGNAMMGFEAGNDRAQDIAAKVQAWQRGDRERGMSPEAAKAEIASAQGRLDKNGGTLNQVGNLISSPLSDSADKEYKQYKGDQGLTGNKALAELIAALDRNTVATKAGAPAGGPGGGGSVDPANRGTSIPARTGK